MSAYRTASPPPDEPPPPPPLPRSPRKPIGLVMTTLSIRDFLRARQWKRIVLAMVVAPAVIFLVELCSRLAAE